MSIAEIYNDGNMVINKWNHTPCIFSIDFKCSGVEKQMFFTEKQFNAMLESQSGKRVLTCVYCGHEYPQDTPASGDQVLTEHIKVCEKHPLRKAEEKIQKLRSALSGFIECKEEDLTIELLQSMLELNNRFAPDERTRSVCAYAIQVLIETMEAGK